MPVRQFIRIAAGFLTFLVLVIICSNTIGAADTEMDWFEPSAVRLTKIFAEGIFYAIIAIGCAFCTFVATSGGKQ